MCTLSLALEARLRKLFFSRLSLLASCQGGKSANEIMEKIEGRCNNYVHELVVIGVVVCYLMMFDVGAWSSCFSVAHRSRDQNEIYNRVGDLPKRRTLPP